MRSSACDEGAGPLQVLRKGCRFLGDRPWSVLLDPIRQFGGPPCCGACGMVVHPSGWMAPAHGDLGGMAFCVRTNLDRVVCVGRLDLGTQRKQPDLPRSAPGANRKLTCARTVPCALRSCRIARLVGRINGGACAIASATPSGALDAAGLPWTIVRRRADTTHTASGPAWGSLWPIGCAARVPENGAPAPHAQGAQAARGRQAAP